MNLLKVLSKVYFLFFILFFLGRCILYVLYFDRFQDISLGESLLTFVFGARMDTIVISMILVFPAIFLAIAPKRFASEISKFLKIYTIIWFVFLIFLENATIPFFAQYDVRPNYIFIQYLEYPQEILSLMFKDYKLELLISFVMMYVGAKTFYKVNFIDFNEAFKTAYIFRLMLLLPVLIILFIGIRSSFGHRPANDSDAFYSANRIIGEITKNSIYSIGYAYYSNSKNSSKMIEKYGKIEIKEAYSLASEALNIPINDIKNPFKRIVKTNFKTQNPKNLVIFIQESMGAQFVEFSGGEKNLTPNMNRYGKEYLAFSNLYSTGTRSIRGLEAMTSGFLPIAGEGVVKRTKSQHDFFTVAKLLKPYGYKSSFIYGGEGRFDNMKGWYLGNGFDEVIEQKHFTKPTFVSTWGVCDEDLVIKANERFKEYNKNSNKFVSVMFSQSNHAPFELPDNKINFVNGEPRQSVKNAIRYADFAIGRFFELAKKEDYYKNTIFVVVADHNVRVYGDEVVPVSMFQIPAVIIGESVKAQTYSNIASQPDVLATALDLIGLDLEYPILGHSIFSKNKQNTALMLFNDVYAFRKDDEIVVLRHDIKPETYKYENKKLIKTENNNKLEKSALSIVNVIANLYEDGLYK